MSFAPTLWRCPECNDGQAARPIRRSGGPAPTIRLPPGVPSTRNGRPAPRTMVGAGASGGAVAWSLLDAVFKVVCHEQGDRVKPASKPHGRDDGSCTGNRLQRGSERAQV